MRPSRVDPVAAHSKSPHHGIDSGAGPAHQVQFYENDDFLTSTVSDFLAAGLHAGQPLVVYATEARRNAFTRALKGGGFDVEGATRSGQLTLFDARETLDSFMTGSTIDPVRFRSAVGDALERIRRRGNGQAILRLYGEMVDLLWRDGNTDGALRLEEMWNDLAASMEFQLLCAYAMGNFYRASDADRFHAICRQHTHVAPTERYLQTDVERQLIEITLLEQRARSLESEIEHRRELEQRLREVLVDRDRLLEAERAARAEAESANRAKSQFLAVMSHELRTPLNAIAGHVQLLDMGVYGPTTDAQRDALKRIERSQRHLLHLITDVLNLARIESGRLEYAIEAVPVAEAVRGLLAMIEPQLAARRLGYDVRLPETPLSVQADREKLEQILLNLLSNAIKFSNAGGRITVDVTSRADRPDAVFIRVCDTGVGIPRSKQEEIFEPFVQVHDGPTRPADGAGLGLAISRDLARGMGGDLRVRSAVGKGSTFTLTLPRATREPRRA